MPRIDLHGPPLCAAIALACALASGLSACTNPDFYADHRDSVSFQAGDAVASNIAVQTIDPWPRAASNRNIDGNGERTQKAIERYRTNKITPPDGLNTTQIQSQATSSQAAPSP